MSASDSSENQRAQQAEKIAAAPRDYKVCEGCGSIVAVRAVTCPNCHAYHFETEPALVAARARELAARAPHSVLKSDLV
jgi:predicted CXXCH cytochrome family protein